MIGGMRLSAVVSLFVGFAFLSASLLQPVHAESGWIIQNLRETHGRSGDIAMVIDGQDRLHAAFMGFYGSEWSLIYARLDSDGWSYSMHMPSTEDPISRSVSIALRGNDSVHICVSPWPDNEDLLYVTNEGGSWDSLTIPVGLYRSGSQIAVDSQGRAHILASVMVIDHQAPDGTDFVYDFVKHVVVEDGEWQVSDLLSGPMNYGWYAPHSFVMDDMDRLYALISYTNKSGGPHYQDRYILLNYLYGNFDSYVTILIDNTTMLRYGGGSLALDSYNRAHVVYYPWNGSAFNLAYYFDPIANHTAEIVGFASSHIPSPCSVFIDPARKAHIAFYRSHYIDYLKESLTLTYATNKGGSWELSSVDSNDRNDFYGSAQIAVDSQGTVHIAYFYNNPTGPESYDIYMRYATTGELPEALNTVVVTAVIVGTTVAALLLVLVYLVRRSTRGPGGY